MSEVLLHPLEKPHPVIKGRKVVSLLLLALCSATPVFLIRHKTDLWKCSPQVSADRQVSEEGHTLFHSSNFTTAGPETSKNPRIEEHRTWVNLVNNNLPRAAVPNGRPAWLKTGSCPSKDSRCWDYCMPMKGDMSRENCVAASKYELLHRQPQDGHCHASALHMLLDDVIFAMKLVTLQPMLVGGTLVGAFRNGTIIRWTRDVDILYNKTAFDSADDRLALELETLGYNIFFQDIWRVCINFAHPLASNIYHEDRCANADKAYHKLDVPYVDMYPFTQHDSDTVGIYGVKKTLQFADIFPVRTIELLGKEYETLAKPQAYFRAVKYSDVMIEHNTGM